MKIFKKLLVLAALGPAAAFAGTGSATGTITHMFISSAAGDIIYVSVSGMKSYTPASPPLPCQTGTYEFVIPRSSSFYQDLFTLLQNAQISGGTVTITGTGTCSIASNTETIAGVLF